VRVAAVEKKHFDVTDFVSEADIKLDRSGGSVFLNMNGAAKVEGNRAARSTLTLGGFL
jgi:hypothetical protein